MTMTDRRSRREFMGLTVAGAAGVLTRPLIGGVPLSRALPAPSADPDLIVYNAKVYTMDPTVPRAEAFAVMGGRFVAVGKSADIKSLAGKRTQRFDAKQMTRPWLHRYAQPRGRHDAPVRGVGRQSVRSGVRHHREHRREAQGQGAHAAGRHV